MFTGIVREKGRVASFERGRLVIESGIAAEIGDSVAVDGVCLKLTGSENGHLAFDVMVETLDRVKPFGNEVNLEPAVRAGEPLGGHFVQGHVDGHARVTAFEPEGDGARLRVQLPPELHRYCVEKGSIAVDGVSLTIAALQDDGLEIALVPFTLEHTTL